MSAPNAEPSADPRAVKSRGLLITAMLRLLGRDPAAPAISDLVREAGVSRPTFYQHFGDVPSLIHAAAMSRLQATFDQLERPSTGAGWDEFADRNLTLLLREVAAHRGFYLAVLDGPSGIQLHTAFTDFLTERILLQSPLGAAIRACAARTDNEDEDLARFLAGGAMALVERGLRAETPVPELVRRLSTLFVTMSGAVPDVTATP